MPFGIPITTNALVDFKDNFIQAWHNSAEPGQPGYIAPAMEQINNAGVTVGNGTTQFTAPAPSNIFDEEQNYAVPNVNSNFSTTTPYVSTPRNGTAVTERPWKNDEINVNAVGTHNSYNRGYDNVGGLLPGWELGLDDVPYNPALANSLLNDSRSNGNSNSGGGSNSAGSYPVSNVLNTRTFPFTSRTPSGSVYAPDLSAYNDSSLFNYEGPGGVPEYTYGQGLRTGGADYSIFGSPADAANPYFAGQFATPAGPADAAINMPAVELPSGVQPISADVSMPGFTSGNQIIGGSLPSDLTYQQTIDEMGIFGPNNPPPSTLFPSPGDTSSLTDRMLEDSPLTGLPMDAQLQEADAAGAQRKALADLLKFRAQDRSMAQNQAAADAAMGSRLGYPNDAYTQGVLSGEIPALDQVISEYQAENPTTQQKMDMLQARANQVYDNMTAEEKRDGLFIEPTYSVSKDTMKLGIPDIFATNNENVSSTGNLINRTPPERNIFKADEIDIPTPPFRPEGVEGEDFYQDVTGNFFDINDDLGTQPLKSVPDMMSAGPDSRGARGDSSRPLTEAELAPDTGELTSGDMGALNDAMTAIDAKYAGSKTDASAEAELTEILNATLNAFGGGGSTNARGAKGETVPADIPAFLNQDISRMADKYVPSPAESDYPPAYQSYAREDEGTSTGESLFQNVAEDIPLSVFNPMDRVVMQAEAQAAQVAKAQAAAQAQAQAQAQAAAQARAAAQAQAAAAAQAQAAAQARAAAEAEARRNPPRPTPVPTYNPPQKNVISKPSPKPGGRAGAGATSQAYKTFARNYGGRYGL